MNIARCSMTCMGSVRVQKSCIMSVTGTKAAELEMHRRCRQEDGREEQPAHGYRVARERVRCGAERGLVRRSA